MIFELRRYVPCEGKEAELEARFRESTLDLFEEMGFKMLDFWIERSDAREIWYLMFWADENEMQEGWARFRDNDKWIEVKRRTEAAGPLAKKIESRVLERPDYAQFLTERRGQT